MSHFMVFFMVTCQFYISVFFKRLHVNFTFYSVFNGYMSVLHVIVFSMVTCQFYISYCIQRLHVDFIIHNVFNGYTSIFFHNVYNGYKTVSQFHSSYFFSEVTFLFHFSKCLEWLRLYIFIVLPMITCTCHNVLNGSVTFLYHHVLYDFISFS